MSTFSNAVTKQESTRTETTNGMKARKGTGSACMDLFYKIGASRGTNIIPLFEKAYVEDSELAVRIILYARDVRAGMGERQIFRSVLEHISKNYPMTALLVINKIPEIGRWDDMFSVTDSRVKEHCVSLIKTALESGDGLCAKWMPREKKGVDFKNFVWWNQIRKSMSLSAKEYRKMISRLTKVVEQQMCSNDWDNINFSHVPSVASSIYKKAFNRHTEKYAEYVSALKSGDKSVKINASAIFPHDVLKGRIGYYGNIFDSVELDAIEMQWNALPNYITNGSILPIVDVSASMTWDKVHRTNFTPLDIAVSLGLYCADKNTGKFKDLFMTFSSEPELVQLKGNINQKINQMTGANVGGSTDLEAAMKLILKTALKGNVPKEEMPKTLIIFSDMQFDYCTENADASAIKMIKKMFKEYDYDVPQVVFWNLHSHDNVPVKQDKSGTALVSGFSTSIIKNILAAKQFDPYSIMMDTVMNPRYDF